jgi:hypothetical protein
VRSAADEGMATVPRLLISGLPEPDKHELRGQRQPLMARRRLTRSLPLSRRLEVKRIRCASGGPAAAPCRVGALLLDLGRAR